MEPSYVNSTAGGATSGTAVTCSAPAGIQAGDIIIALINLNGNRTVNENNGATPFTTVTDFPRTYNGASGTYYIKYRVAGASEPATYAWTLSGSDRWQVILSVYRGCDTSAIFDVAPSAAREVVDSTSTFTSGNLTTGVNNAMIVFTAVQDSATNTFTSTPGDSFNARQNANGNELSLLADKLLATAGTQAAVTFTGTNSDVPMQMFSLKPATTPSGNPWYAYAQQ